MNKDFLIITVGRVVQSVLGIISMRILTSLLSPAEVGNYFLVLSIVGFCVFTLISPLGMYVNRRLHKWESDGNLLRRFFIGNLYLVAVALFSALAAFTLNRGFGVGSSIALTGFVYLAGFYTYFSTFNQTVIPAFNMLDDRLAFVSFTVATLALGLACSALFSVTFSRTAISWLAGQTLALGAVGFLALVYLRRKTAGRAAAPAINERSSRAQFGPALSFAWPLAITYFFMWSQNWSYRIIVEKMIGPDFLGLVGVGLGIAAGMAAAVESIAQQFYFPGFYKEINSGDQAGRAAAWNRMARVTLPLYLSFAIMVSFMSPFILKLLAGAKFNTAFVFLICGAWIEFFRMATNILATVAHSEMRTRHLIKSYLTGAVIAVGGTFYAARQAQHWGVIPVILAASGLAMACVMYYDMRKLMRLKVFTGELAASGLLSVPFAAAVLFYGFRDSIFASGVICAVFGLYFLAVQYGMSRRLCVPAQPEERCV